LGKNCWFLLGKMKNKDKTRQDKAHKNKTANKSKTFLTTQEKIVSERWHKSK